MYDKKMGGEKEIADLYSVFSIRDALASKLDADTIVSRELRGELNCKGSIWILNQVDVDVCAVWGLYATGDFANTSLWSIDCYNSFFLDDDSFLQTLCKKN